jgi:two-component system nitrogen regulation response regulator GlnG
MIGKKAKLLLVDDEPLVLRSLQKTLLRAGFSVETAKDCTSGLATFETAQAEGAPFAMAILDINMPGFDELESTGAGLTLLDQLKVRRPDLPVVMLSAYDEVDKAKDAVSRGARAYCVKGREQGLVDIVNQILAD